MRDGISKTFSPQEAGNCIKTEEYAPSKALFAQGFSASCIASQGVVAQGRATRNDTPPG